MKKYKGFEIEYFTGVANITETFRPKYKAVKKCNLSEDMEIIGNTLKDIKNQINRYLNYTFQDARMDLLEFAEKNKDNELIKFYFNLQ